MLDCKKNLSASQDLYDRSSRTEYKFTLPVHKKHARNASRICCTSRNFLSARSKRFCLVIFYSWLLMNIDPSYARRSLSSLIASRLLGGVLRSSGSSSTGGSLSAIEVIALIQAMNNQRSAQIPNELMDYLKASTSVPGMTSLAKYNALQRQQMQSLDRQLPVPVPVPTPLPIAVVFTAIAAFFAAVASGLQPLVAVVAAFIAAYVAFLAIIVIVFASVAKKSKQEKALIKKLVIKKTVLPFVIPIPIKKKEIHYKYIHKPKEEHHHQSSKGKVKHAYKYKKIDSELPDSAFGELHKLIREQDQIQKVLQRMTEKEVGKRDLVTRRTKRSLDEGHLTPAKIVLGH